MLTSTTVSKKWLKVNGNKALICKIGRTSCNFDTEVLAEGEKIVGVVETTEAGSFNT